MEGSYLSYLAVTIIQLTIEVSSSVVNHPTLHGHCILYERARRGGIDGVYST